MERAKDGELVSKVIIFLVILVGAILVYNEYQFLQIEKNFLNYIAIALILALAGLVAYMLVQKPSGEHKHHSAHEHQSEKIAEESAPWTSMEKLSVGLIALVGLMIFFNQMQISQVSGLMGVGSGPIWKFSSSKTSLKLTGDPSQDAIAIVIPRGAPFYGEQMGVSFDDPIRSLEVIAQLDPAYGRNKVRLDPEQKQRYIKIGMVPSMGCQYCCGADTLVFKDGSPTCGCKHSWAMRGLSAYLIKNYPDMSDEEIIREVSKWKGLFFPKQMVAKYIKESQSGQYSPDIASLLMDVDEEKLAEMKAAVAASGSADTQNTAASVDDLPSMVGGC